MLKFNYLTFVCEQDELQSILTEKGQEGWRLHTCEPVVTTGIYGSGVMSVFIVMDQAFQEDEQEYEVPEQSFEGLEMKG